MCKSNEILSNYRKYLEALIASGSSDRFSNGGIDFAPILMSVLFDNTRSIARIYAQGFRPDLITTPDYWASLTKFLSQYKTIQVLVETPDYRHEAPIEALRPVAQQNSKVGVHLICADDKKKFDETLGGHTNFAVFDNDKFRLEYDPVGFKAFGSFNDPYASGTLIKLFDDAYARGTDVLSMD